MKYKHPIIQDTLDIRDLSGMQDLDTMCNNYDVRTAMKYNCHTQKGDLLRYCTRTKVVGSPYHTDSYTTRQ